MQADDADNTAEPKATTTEPTTDAALAEVA
jgi:hypothetical protein